MISGPPRRISPNGPSRKTLVKLFSLYLYSEMPELFAAWLYLCIRQSTSYKRACTMPDFRSGFPLKDLLDGRPVAGKVEDNDVLLVRHGSEVFAVGAFCTHYHGSLADGLVVDDTLRCPLHHACFSLRTGEALRAPAFDSIDCWATEIVQDMVYVRQKISRPVEELKAPAGAPKSVVIIGGGAAAFSAAEMLRREGYQGELTMLSSDDVVPCDRPISRKTIWLEPRLPSGFP